MRVAVAAAAPDLLGPMSQHGARAPFFLIFDGGGNLVETLANPHAQKADHVGELTAEWLAGKEITIVVSPHFGPYYRDALTKRGIRFLEHDGIVNDIVKEIGSS
jgi:predicted Fe-Mo cluster-binding NifX family protein